MALMTDDIQEKLIKLLVDEGLVSREVIDRATKQSAKTNKPLLTVLEDIGEIDDELLTHAIAHVSGVPYVNLTAITAAERYCRAFHGGAASRGE